MLEFLKAAQEIQMKLLEHDRVNVWIHINSDHGGSGEKFATVTFMVDGGKRQHASYSYLSGSLEAMKETASKYISELSE